MMVFKIVNFNVTDVQMDTLLTDYVPVQKRTQESNLVRPDLALSYDTIQDLSTHLVVFFTPLHNAMG